MQATTIGFQSTLAGRDLNHVDVVDVVERYAAIFIAYIPRLHVAQDYVVTGGLERGIVGSGKGERQDGKVVIVAVEGNDSHVERYA